MIPIRSRRELSMAIVDKGIFKNDHITLSSRLPS